jgi:hypothetical protein
MANTGVAETTFSNITHQLTSYASNIVRYNIYWLYKLSEQRNHIIIFIDLTAQFPNRRQKLIIENWKETPEEKTG